MSAKALVEELLTLPDVTSQRYLLEEQASLLNDEVASLLKEQADHFLRADIRISLEIANLLSHIAELKGNPLYRALGLLVEANARSIGLGEYTQAIELYDEAAEIYHSLGYMAEQARSQ